MMRSVIALCGFLALLINFHTVSIMTIPEKEFVVQTLEHNHILELSNLFAHVFVNHEPLAVSQNISFNEFKQIILETIEDSLLLKQSYVAVDKQTNKIAGGVICNDFFSSLYQPEREQHPITAILYDASDSYRQEQNISKGSHLHIHFIATDESYRGKGAIKLLLANCLYRAAESGYQVAVAEATSLISQRIFSKELGFKVEHEINYNAYTYKGRKPFQIIKQHSGLQFLSKRIV